MLTEEALKTEIRDELENIAIRVSGLDLAKVDSGDQAFFITLISNDYDGQTYLDREERTRPAVLRALIRGGFQRASFVLNCRTPEEFQTDKARETSTPQAGDPTEDAVERASRAEWRTEQGRILRVLEESDFSVQALENGVFALERETLSTERTLIAFSNSVRSTTVDLDARKTMQDMRSTLKIGAAYYISPTTLDNPFSNQTRPDWLTPLSSTNFLHTLNGSKAICKALLEEAQTSVESLPAYLRGKTIDASCFDNKTQTEREVLPFVQEWSKQSSQTSLLLLLGNAGVGKTTTTQRLAVDYATKFLESADPDADRLPVPVIVPFESVRRLVDFASLLHRRLDRLRGHSYEAFRELLHLGRAVLIVDGFDELADDAGMEAAESQIRSLRVLFGRSAKIVLAGRSVFTSLFAHGGGLEERFQRLIGPDVSVSSVELLPFSPEQTEEFIKTRTELGESARQSILQFTRQSEDNQELAASPLFLSMLAAASFPDGLGVGSNSGSIQALILAICTREETRQQHGFGIKNQLQFLGQLSTEMFITGNVRLPESDVAIWAGLHVDTQQTGSGPAPSSRLLSHALLSRSAAKTLTFIHPFIRDTILGMHIGSRPGEKDFNEAFERWDLPSATIRFLGGSETFQTISPLGENWLSEPGRHTQQHRRNLFRLWHYHFAVAMSRRDWLPKAVVIRGMDLSRLTIESTDFLSTQFIGCVFDGTLFDACSFTANTLTDSSLNGSVFDECDFLYTLELECTQVRGVVVRSGNEVSYPETPEALASLARQPTTTENSDRVALDAVVRTLQRLLSELLDGERNYSKYESQLTGITFANSIDKTIFDSVVLPLAQSHLFVQTNSAGSKLQFQVRKDFRRQCRTLIESGVAEGETLRKLVDRMARKARRFMKAG